MEKITESSSFYRNLEEMDVPTLLQNINQEDQTVPLAVQKAIPSIAALVEAIVERMQQGGRLFYIGAGTSGRLGVLDASEIPPTFGAPPDWVIGLIAGGDRALRTPVEHAEDNLQQAWTDLKQWQINAQDLVVGIAASGATPYVVEGLKSCRENGIATGCISCNPGAPILEAADYPVLVVVGPEFVTGSTRMKAGTAQKLVLNMISTSVMIRLGRVKDNKMVDMLLSNEKLIDRGANMIVQASGMEYNQARQLLLRFGNVRAALQAIGGM
ncbi:MAG: N-acetylmuramic acid 6-phosphate etherase [Bacteroidetes bacterium]|nr:N-acetylmuramic acid 6-phosphate etherase [Bacteroidota bacterium]